jgi:hypothetical protein
MRQTGTIIPKLAMPATKKLAIITQLANDANAGASINCCFIVNHSM